MREHLSRQAISRGLKPADIIHPTVKIGLDVKLGSGVIACHYAIITTNVRTGHFCLHNCYSFTGHDVRMGNYVTVSPYSVLLGESSADDGAWLATRSTLTPRTRMGVDSTLAAGAVALNDVPPGVVAKGVPARWPTMEGEKT